MKNKRANLSCVRTVLLQAGKGHAARTTIKQNNKTNIIKKRLTIHRSNSIQKQTLTKMSFSKNIAVSFQSVQCIPWCKVYSSTRRIFQ